MDADESGVVSKPLPPGVDPESLFDELEASLSEEDPEESIAARVQDWFHMGLDEGEALGVLKSFQERLDRERRVAKDDAVLEVILRLAGWAEPDRRIRRP
jgi:hypothetical protein